MASMDEAIVVAMLWLHRFIPDYGLVLIDCPPSHSPLALAPLGVAPWVLVPVEARVLALSGIASLVGTTGLARLAPIREMPPSR